MDGKHVLCPDLFFLRYSSVELQHSNNFHCTFCRCQE